MYTWGCGEYGRLGHSDNVTQLRPKQVKALAGQRVIQVACGSRDAQTLALTDEGLVYSWGDGDFGKLGRGGSEQKKAIGKPLSLDFPLGWVLSLRIAPSLFCAFYRVVHLLR